MEDGVNRVEILITVYKQMIKNEMKLELICRLIEDREYISVKEIATILEL